MILKSDRERLEKIKEYIEQNLGAELHIAVLSSMFGLSIPTLRRQFQKYFQIPIYRYISRERMEYAKRLLLGYTHTIYEISELVGYSEPSNFTHAFTNYFGVAPSRFGLKSDFNQYNY